ncbi:MAG: glycosyl hydrolase 115 family protein [Ignavibacteria bacterium]|jgi:uncharacterized protein YbcI
MEQQTKNYIIAVVVVVLILSTMLNHINAQDSYITTNPQDGFFVVSTSGVAAPILLSSPDFKGVKRVANHLQNDIQNVTGKKPPLITDTIPETGSAIIVGTIGKSKLIDELIKRQKLDTDQITGKWETFLIQTIESPFPGIKTAVVIAGSDKRGTIYGMFDMSEKIGVSPWYWWADAPVKKKTEIYVKPGRYTLGEPKVKYRGIFINDEAPALSGWSQEKYGTVQFNHKLYQHVFELILRLKGNFLWPAMWGRAFYDDDPKNPELADEYGIVISTSHHEPMMRAHVEWERYGSGPWNYEKNAEVLRKFWREGIERMGSNESIVTLAMRGDGDEAMSPNANIELLQNIVKDQREIIAEVTGKDVTTIPQVWALYKEVQEYYDKGMRVPDDVTLLLCDDNWGNIRKLPNLKDEPREGGYGIYYHFDYVGGPRNYKWLNTNQIERVREQMHLAYEYGAKEIWIVNVGDIKPMEFPIDFFLDYAWDPEAISAEDLPSYYVNWAEEQFGSDNSREIADILAKYTKYNSRRKPEMLSPSTYSLTNYSEAETIVNDYNDLYKKAKSIYDSIPVEYKDAFYQLVLHPVEACSNLNELYVTTAKNRLYAEQGRNTTNELAEKVEELFEKDAAITNYYNEELTDGKWNHMMDQTHIGYTYWQQPDENSMPEVAKIDIPDDPEMGVSVESSEDYWTDGESGAVLPVFDNFNNQSYYFEIFNRGKIPFEYFVKPADSWIKVSSLNGEIKNQVRLRVNIDWDNAPKGKKESTISISGPGSSKISVKAIIENNNSLSDELKNCFVESNGFISIEAVNYSNSVESNVEWKTIPNLGRTNSAVTLMPGTVSNLNPSENGSRLEYNTYFFSTGEANVKFYLSPALNFGYSEGLRLGVSMDDGEPQIINVNENDTPDWKYPQYWNIMVANNTRYIDAKFKIDRPGKHILKFWAVDAGIVLQKIVIDMGGVKQSYLGPPQSYNSTLINEQK